RRDRSRDPARAQSRIRRQVRAEGGRARDPAARRDRPEEGLLPGAGAEVPARREPRVRARRDELPARSRARPVPPRLRRQPVRSAERAPDAAERLEALADRRARDVAANPRNLTTG